MVKAVYTIELVVNLEGEDAKSALSLSPEQIAEESVDLPEYLEMSLNLKPNSVRKASSKVEGGH